MYLTWKQQQHNPQKVDFLSPFEPDVYILFRMKDEILPRENELDTHNSLKICP
jgi:hypothetical protein